MIKNILTVSALAIFGAAAYADEPMTRDAVVEAAKDGIEFVGNTYVQERKTWSAPPEWSTRFISPAVPT